MNEVVKYLFLTIDLEHTIHACSHKYVIALRLTTDPFRGLLSWASFYDPIACQLFQLIFAPRGFAIIKATF